MNDIFVNETLQNEEVSGKFYLRQKFFAVVGFSFTATLFLASLLSQNLIILLAAIIAALLIPCLLFRQIRQGKVMVVVLVTALVACTMFFGRMHFLVNPTQNLNGVSITFTGQIVREVEHNDGLFVYTVRTNFIDHEDAPQQVLFELITYDRIHAEVYDTISADIEFSTPRPENRRRALANGTYLSGYLQMWSEVEVEPAENRPLSFIAIQARRNAVRTISDFLPQDEAAIVQGLTLSHTANINREVRDSFARAGVGHMLAVSGQHLAIIMQAAFALFLVKFHKRTAALLTIPIVWAFIALAGFPTGAVRSGIMATIFLIFLALGKQSNGLNSLGAAVLIMTLINPFIIMDLSFLLSVMATAGILTLANPLYKFFSKRLLPDKTEDSAKSLTSRRQSVRSFLKFTYKAFSVCIAASVFLLPIFVFEFGFIAILAPISSVLVYFAVSTMLVLTVGLIALAFLPFTDFLLYPGFMVVGFLARYTIIVTNLLANFPFGIVSLSADFVPFWFAFTLLILAVVAVFKRRKFIRPAAILLITFTFVVGMISQGIIEQNTTTISVLQVGSGQMIVVQSQGQTALVGVGGTQGANRALREYMTRNNIRQIDTVLIPSVNNFFALNAVNVLRNVEVGEIILPEERENTIGFALGSLGSLNVRETQNLEQVEIIDGIFAKTCKEQGVTVLQVGYVTVSVVHPGGTVAQDSNIIITGALFAENLEEFSHLPIIVSVAPDFAHGAVYRLEQMGATNYRLTTSNFVQVRLRR